MAEINVVPRPRRSAWPVVVAVFVVVVLAVCVWLYTQGRLPGVAPRTTPEPLPADTMPVPPG